MSKLNTVIEVKKPSLEQQALDQRLTHKFKAAVSLGCIGVVAAMGGGVTITLTPAVLSASSPLTAILNNPIIASFFATAIACFLVAACVGFSMIPDRKQKRVFFENHANASKEKLNPLTEPLTGTTHTAEI